MTLPSSVTSVLTFLKPFFTLPTKAQVVEIARRAVATFVATFSTALVAGVSGVTSVATAEALLAAAAVAGGNTVIRLVFKPALKEYVPVFHNDPAAKPGENPPA